MLTLQRSSIKQNPKVLSAAPYCFLLCFKIWLPLGRIGYRNKTHKHLSTNQTFSMAMFYLISYLFLDPLKWIHESVWFLFKIRQLRWLWVLLFVLFFVCLLSAVFAYFLGLLTYFALTCPTFQKDLWFQTSLLKTCYRLTIFSQSSYVETQFPMEWY